MRLPQGLLALPAGDAILTSSRAKPVSKPGLGMLWASGFSHGHRTDDPRIYQLLPRMILHHFNHTLNYSVSRV